jgi:hypothetical protein
MEDLTNEENSIRGQLLIHQLVQTAMQVRSSSFQLTGLHVFTRKPRSDLSPPHGLASLQVIDEMKNIAIPNDVEVVTKQMSPRLSPEGVIPSPAASPLFLGGGGLTPGPSSFAGPQGGGAAVSAKGPFTGESGEDTSPAAKLHKLYMHFMKTQHELRNQIEVLKRIKMEKESAHSHGEQHDLLAIAALQQKRDNLRHSITLENSNVKYLIDNLREMRSTVDLLKAK